MSASVIKTEHDATPSSRRDGACARGPSSSSVDWLIVGGGIHGVHVAARLIGEGGLDASQVRILDPGEDLLERWCRCTEATGMSHLRSPGVHHLDLEPFSLVHFAGSRRNRRRCVGR